MYEFYFFFPLQLIVVMSQTEDLQGKIDAIIR